MSGLPAAMLLLAGAAAVVACLRRAVAEHPGARATWLALAAVAGIESGWAVMHARSALGAAGHFESLTGPSLLLHLLHLATVPVGLLALLTGGQPPRERFHRLQRLSDGFVTALAFGLLAWELVLPAALASAESRVQVVVGMQAVGNVVLATVAVLVLARSQRPGGRPFRVVAPVSVAVLLLVAGDVVSEMVLALPRRDVFAGALAVVAAGLAALVAAALTPRRRDGGSARSAHLREVVGVLAPVLPLALVGFFLVRLLALHRPLSPVGEVLAVALLVAILAGKVLARLESVMVARTLEDRVEARTLDLGTRERWFSSLVQHASDVVTVVDRRGVIRYQTPSGLAILGHEADRLVGAPFHRLLKPEDGPRFSELLASCLRAPGVGRTTELDVAHRDGRWLRASVTATSRLDDEVIRGLVVTLRDVTEHRRLEEQLTAQAFTDPLTGLANRAYFGTRVEEAVVDARPRGVGVLFVDLDGFKAVNDSLGHQVGDRVLEVVGQRLRGCVRPGDVVARLGGDEFGVLIVGTDVDDAVGWVARRVFRQLSTPVQVGDREIGMGASTGVAVNDAGVETADQLLRNADLAMYRAKASPRAMFVRFEERMHEALLARLQVQTELRQAVAHDEITVRYQPLVELSSGLVVAAEALARWQHPERGLLAPADFIALAEEIGQVDEIGQWILRAACRQAVAWQRFGREEVPFGIGVNISVRQLVPGFPRVVRQVLDEAGLPPGTLTLEVTESVLLDRTEEVLTVLRGLRQLGVRLALDDFGTGYSSLSYLSQLPVHSLKIDRSFVEQVGRPDDGGRQGSTEVARTIVRLAGALSLSTVAEGVETEAEHAALLAMGCDLAQGFHYGHPMTAEELTERLTDQRATHGPFAPPKLTVVQGHRPGR